MGFWHDLGTPSGWFGGGGSSKPDPGIASALSAQTTLLATQTAQAKASADAALKAQTDANLIAAAAAVPQADSESARATADDQRRKLMAGSSFGIGLPSQLGAPPVGFRLLAGQ